MNAPNRSLFLLVAGFLLTACATPPAPLRGRSQWSFDEVQEGKLPAGFTIDATRRAGALASWEVVASATAPSAPKALALTYPNHKSYDSFNLCWLPGMVFRDGSLSVKLRARSGKEDQGGGLIWRAAGPNDYYVVRLNPLESNLRLYHVLGGTRTMLGSADCAARTGEWHELRIEHRGEWITCSVDGQERLAVRDAALPAAGGIGLWTKADAATEFDDLVAEGAN